MSDSRAADRRGRSSAVGVALLICVTVLALGGLTAGIGSIVYSGATAADTERIAEGLASAVSPAQTVGIEEHDLVLTEGVLYAEPRTVRILNATDGIDEGEATVEVVETVRGDALIYEADDRRIVVHAGAVLRSEGGSEARMYREPQIATSGAETLAVGATAIDANDVAISTAPDARLRVQTDASHERIELGTGTFHVAVETEHPEAWERHFERQGATVITTSARFEGDDADSVVAHFQGHREGLLIVHEVDLEVTRR